MMYQVKATLYFKDNDEAVDFFHDCELAFDKAEVINPDNPNREDCVIEYIANRHDEDPNAPCVLMWGLTTKIPIPH